MKTHEQIVETPSGKRRKFRVTWMEDTVPGVGSPDPIAWGKNYIPVMWDESMHNALGIWDLIPKPVQFNGYTSVVVEPREVHSIDDLVPGTYHIEEL